MTKPPPAISVITGLPRPRWRGLIHTYAFWFSIPLAGVLVVGAGHPLGRVAAAVYAASLLAVYGVSAAYHRLAHSPTTQRLMRRLDHSMIFVLIAGTYTPVCLVALDAGWRLPLLGAVWTLALFGIGAKARGDERVVRASNGLYLAMGWVGLIAAPSLFRELTPAAFGLLVAGGLLYTVGAALFFLRRPDPHPLVFGYHEVWHLFTVMAGVSHFAMVALVVA
ncbi:MAG: hemolysin III family protein [Acidimicrobiales bacterium]